MMCLQTEPVKFGVNSYINHMTRENVSKWYHDFLEGITDICDEQGAVCHFQL